MISELWGWVLLGGIILLACGTILGAALVLYHVSLQWWLQPGDPWRLAAFWLAWGAAMTVGAGGRAMLQGWREGQGEGG